MLVNSNTYFSTVFDYFSDYKNIFSWDKNMTNLFSSNLKLAKKIWYTMGEGNI